jgi:hypothetical protein
MHVDAVAAAGGGVVAGGQIRPKRESLGRPEDLPSKVQTEQKTHSCQDN